MPSVAHEFLRLIEKNVRFEYHSGASTWVTHPHSTGWRTLPSLVVAHLKYASILEQSGGPARRIEKGQTVSVAPGLMHRLTMAGPRPGYSHWSHIQCEILQGVSLFDLIEPVLIIEGKRSLRIASLNRALAKIASADLLMSVLRRQALGWELVTTLLENVPFKEERIGPVRNASRFTAVLTYIEQNLGNPISHQLLSRTAGLSPSRFHVLFRSAFGTAPYEYVQKLRLNKARQLLTRTGRSVAEIGREVGHPDPYHFSRAFRRYVGVSPAAYRKQMVPHSF